MAQDEIRAAEASETSPLLGPPDDAKPPAAGDGASSDEGAGEVVDDAPAADGEAPDGVSREGLPEMAARMHVLLPALGIGLFLCALDQLLAVATYAKIGSDLDALNNTSWIATAYFLTLTSCQPLYGRLSDIFGRKECLLFAYVAFGLGCAGCGLARDMPQLVIARAVAGVGGGGMNTLVSIMLTDIVPLRDRGIWQGYLNIIFATGTAAGAPLGGLLSETVGWRWSFLGQVPLVVVAFIAVQRFLHLPRADHAHWRAKLARVDFLGAATLISAVLALLVGLDAGSNGGWSQRAAAVPLGLAPALLALFVLVEVRVASHPFAPGHVIFDRGLFAGFLANFFCIAGQVPVLFFLPLAYQAVGGLSPVQAGLLLIPGSVTGVAASLGAGHAIRRSGRYYRLTVASFALLLLSVVPLVAFSGAVVVSNVGSTIANAIFMLGAGAGVTATLVALISNAAQADAAIVVACSYLFRSLGSSLGVSLGSAVLQQVLRARLAARLGEGDAARDVADRVRESLDAIRGLDPDVAAAVRACYRDATATVFAACAVPLALALVAGLLVREKRLGK